MDAAAIEPTVTWGINPGPVGRRQREAALSVQMSRPTTRASVAEALEFMSFRGGMPIAGTKIDVAFIGSCTNGRISDLREAARLVQGQHVAKHVKALVVPGSQSVRKIAEQEGLDKIFTAAGFEWRGAGCSMCLAMNPDQLQGRQICASSSNRNFKGRQGSPTGRTLLMSPAMVAAAAVAGEVVDVRKMLAARRGARVMDITLRRHDLRPRRFRCAATTSTPIASSRRGSSRASASKVSRRTRSRTTASSSKSAARCTVLGTRATRARAF